MEKAPINLLIQNVEGMPYGEQVRDYYHEFYSKQVEQACIEGRREVMEWIETRPLVAPLTTVHGFAFYQVDSDILETKLKEWGIE